MLVESISIILILIIMVFIFMRSGRKDYALATSPLLIVPFFHTISNLACDVLKISLDVNIKASIDVLGLAIAVAIMGFVSSKHKTKAARFGYLLVSVGFTALLTIIFIFNYYSYLIER
ncbi:MAG: hypothetical protein RR444_03625 [Oscillospiraceae bacterium]